MVFPVLRDLLVWRGHCQMATKIQRNRNNGLRNDIQSMQRARYGGLVGTRICAKVVRR